MIARPNPSKASPMLSAALRGLRGAGEAGGGGGAAERERRPLGRGVARAADAAPAGACVCARPKSIVFCRGCGYYRVGRVRLQCLQHPTVHFLYDIDVCGQCKAAWYLEETPVPS